MTLSRRSVLRAAATAATGLATAATGLAAAGCAGPSRAGPGRAGPLWVDADPTTLGPTGEPSPSSQPSPQTASTPPSQQTQILAAPYSARLVTELRRYLAPTPENPNHPGYAGAVVLVAVNGVVTTHASVGYAVRYDAGPRELPESARVPMRPDSVFDLASVTKVYTTIAVLQQADRGRIDLAAPVASYLPEFTGKQAVTVSMLLAHTSGLPVPNLSALLKLPDAATRWATIMATPLVATPGSLFRYSGFNLLVAQKLVERVAGQPLDSLIETELTGPLGLRYTGFNPLRWLSSADRSSRLVATDARARGLLRGVVHDQLADSLGGVTGAAGLFSTAADLAAIGHLLLDNGQYRGRRLLAEATVARMLANVNAGLPAVDDTHPGRSSTHGLGVEIDQPWFMGRLSSGQTFGHTGFTGTELVVDRRRRLVLVLLTNRAHPNWTWANPDPTRVAVANILAAAVR